MQDNKVFISWRLAAAAVVGGVAGAVMGAAASFYSGGNVIIGAVNGASAGALGAYMATLVRNDPDYMRYIGGAGSVYGATLLGLAADAAAQDILLVPEAAAIAGLTYAAAAYRPSFTRRGQAPEVAQNS